MESQNEATATPVSQLSFLTALNDGTSRSLEPRPSPRFYLPHNLGEKSGSKIFLQGCEIKSGRVRLTLRILSRYTPLLPSHLVVVVLRGAARVELEVEVSGSREGHRLLELVVVPDGVDGLHQPTQGPGGGDLDGGQLARAAVEESTCLGQRGGGEEGTVAKPLKRSIMLLSASQSLGRCLPLM